MKNIVKADNFSVNAEIKTLKSMTQIMKENLCREEQGSIVFLNPDMPSIPHTSYKFFGKKIEVTAVNSYDCLFFMDREANMYYHPNWFEG